VGFDKSNPLILPLTLDVYTETAKSKWNRL